MRSVLLGLTLWGFACAAPGTRVSLPGSTTAADPAVEARRLDGLFREYYDASVPLNPVNAMMMAGDDRYNDQLPNFFGPAYRVGSESFERLWLNRMQQEINPDVLPPADRVNYDVFVASRQLNIEGFRFPDHLLPVQQQFSIPTFVAMFGSGAGPQPFKTVVDYQNWLDRLDGVVVLFNQSIANMREGTAKGVVQPRLIMERTLPTLAAHVVDDVEKSVFWMPVKNMPDSFSPEDRERLTREYRRAIEHKVIPAYRDLHDYIRDEYLPATRDTFGYWAHPNGEDWYRYRIRANTDSDLTADEIHQIGLEEVERIHAEMRSVMKQVGFAGELTAFFEHAKTDPEFYYDDAEALLDGYREIKKTIAAKLPLLFDIQPKNDYEIRAVESYRAATSAGAHLVPGTPDGSRRSVFYVNTHDLRVLPKWGMETLTLHEAAPGHYFQLALQQEAGALPEFRRFGAPSTAFIEGWALYCESIGKELGLYADPMQYYGHLEADLLRAMRLVVDTGVHAKHWNRQQAIDYMTANSALADSDVVNEVDRYIANPGQALAYKIGQRRIWELRRKAEAALGTRFDIKAFHREMLKDGAMPIYVLAAKIDRWIAAQ